MIGKFNQVCCQNGDFKLCQNELPKLQNNQLLIRVHFSSVNQFDKILMECKKNENFVLGSEGSGIIEDIGMGIDESFRGRKVAFCHDGWSQFVVKKLDECILLDDSVDLRIAADAVTNPMTALCCMKLIKQFGSDCVIIDGAHSSLGQMIIQLCQKENIQLLCISRDDNQCLQLKNEFGLPVNRILNMNVENFQEKFSGDIKDFQRCYYISMLGGALPGCILQMLPLKSQMLVLGSLTKQDLVIPASCFYFQNKFIRGFFLERFVHEELSQQEFRDFCRIIAEDLSSGGKIFGTKVAKEMKLEEWTSALNQLDSVKDGKILLQCC